VRRLELEVGALVDDVAEQRDRGHLHPAPVVEHGLVRQIDDRLRGKLHQGPIEYRLRVAPSAHLEAGVVGQLARRELLLAPDHHGPHDLVARLHHGAQGLLHHWSVVLAVDDRQVPDWELLGAKVRYGE
jgi:hypothetical protein